MAQIWHKGPSNHLVSSPERAGSVFGSFLSVGNRSAALHIRPATLRGLRGLPGAARGCARRARPFKVCRHSTDVKRDRVTSRDVGETSTNQRAGWLTCAESGTTTSLLSVRGVTVAKWRNVATCNVFGVRIHNIFPKKMSCSVGVVLSASCEGELLPRSAFTEDQAELIRRRTGTLRVDNVCDKHNAYVFKFFPLRQTSCCKPAGGHPTKTIKSGLDEIGLDFAREVEALGILSAPLVPGKKLCSNCLKAIRVRINDYNLALLETQKSDPSTNPQLPAPQVRVRMVLLLLLFILYCIVFSIIFD